MNKEESFEARLDEIQHKARIIKEKNAKINLISSLLQQQEAPLQERQPPPPSPPSHGALEGHLYRTSGESEIASLLPLANVKMKREVDAGLGRQFSATIANEKAKWISKTAQPHLEQLQKQQLFETERDYPETIKALYDTAAALVAGEFGEKIRSSIILHLDQPIHPFVALQLLLIQQARKGSTDSLPEIFHDNQSKELLVAFKNLDNVAIEGIMLGGEIELSDEENSALSKMNGWTRTHSLDSGLRKSISQLFHNFIESCLHPSHLTVRNLLQLNLEEEAHRVANQLKNPKDKTKAIEHHINHLLSKNIDKAMALWHPLSTPNRIPIAVKIIESYLNLKRQDEAIAFALNLTHNDERDHLLRETVMLLTQQHELPLALALVEKIHTAEIRAYAKSNIVHILARQNQFPKAKEIALSISDRGYREDAILDIVKAYLQIRHVDDAIQFVDSIKNPYEKKKSAKIIEAAMKAYHLDEKVEKVRQTFALVPKPLRRAA